MGRAPRLRPLLPPPIIRLWLRNLSVDHHLKSHLNNKTLSGANTARKRKSSWTWRRIPHCLERRTCAARNAETRRPFSSRRAPWMSARCPARALPQRACATRRALAHSPFPSHAAAPVHLSRRRRRDGAVLHVHQSDVQLPLARRVVCCDRGGAGAARGAAAAFAVKLKKSLRGPVWRR